MIYSKKIKEYFGESVTKCLIYEVDSKDPTAQQKLVGYFVSDSSEEDAKFFIQESELESLIRDFESDLSGRDREIERLEGELEDAVNEKISLAEDLFESALTEIADELEKDPDHRPNIKAFIRDFRKEMKR